MTDIQDSRVARKKQATNKNNSKKGSKKSIFKKIFLSLVTICFLAAIGVGILFYTWIKDAPKIEAKLLKDPISSKILDKDGNLYTEVGAQSRDFIAFKDIPKQMVN